MTNMGEWEMFKTIGRLVPVSFMHCCFHTRPINVVVFHGPDREHSF